MIVADASILLELLLRTSTGVAAERRLFAAGQTMHVPFLVDIEVAQALRRYALARLVPQVRCEEALADFADLPLQRYPHTFLLPRIWALRTNITAYDASYIALAELLDAPLLTHDGRLRGAPGHSARVELL